VKDRGPRFHSVGVRDGNRCMSAKDQVKPRKETLADSIWAYLAHGLLMTVQESIP
jgi:hypothetical protein